MAGRDGRCRSSPIFGCLSQASFEIGKILKLNESVKEWTYVRPLAEWNFENTEIEKLELPMLKPAGRVPMESPAVCM